MSQVNLDPNVAVELFLLAPGEDPLPPGTVETDGAAGVDGNPSSPQPE
jgi:hypothetical protein